jgi:pancreatic triacylglycerol lipase
MLTHYILLSILLAAAQINAREVCFDDLGCFVDTKPFSGSTQRPVAVLPDTPQKINTSFILYTSRNTPGEFITYSNIPASFNVSLPTKLLVHGFWHDAQRPWVLDMKDALLNASRMNVIAVDWSGGNKLPYTQATANTQVVGAEIARLIKSVCEKSGAKAADFHIIGHSLGAHIAGYTGQRLDGQLGKITGLDPAGPYFEYTEPIVSLDKTDAKFVEVIHTDGSARLALGLGIIQPVGHVDFYPNGGRNQPKCPQVTG